MSPWAVGTLVVAAAVALVCFGIAVGGAIADREHTEHPTRSDHAAREARHWRIIDPVVEKTGDNVSRFGDDQ